MAVVINDKQLLDPVLLQLDLGLVERGADRYGDERLRRHYFGNRNVETRFETQIAVGNDADEQAVLIDDRHAADLEAAP